MKKILLTIIIAFTASFFSVSFAQDSHQAVINKVFGDDGEVYFKFNITDRNEINTLTHIISIDNVKDNEVYAYANRKEFALFLDAGYSYTILPHPGSLLTDAELMNPHPADAPSTTWNFYPTYDQYLSYMAGFASAYPEICKVDTIGYTKQNRLLLAVKISDSVNNEDGEPQFFYSSSIHGDEITGYVMMLHLIDSLLTGYGNSPRITDIVNNTEIFICPLANPDGTYHGGNNSVNGAIRYNANYIDLNRNYPDPEDGQHPDGEEWQPETVAFMAYADSNFFNMGANFHGGSEVFNYPWDTWSKRAADDAWWQYVGHEFVDTIHNYSPSSYFSDFNNGITNGYDWYTISGGRQDYMNYFKYCREVTIEISNTKLPLASKLLTFWNYNCHSLLNFLEQANYSIQGFITDTVTGEPLSAKVFILGHDKDNSFVFSKLPSGFYSRLLNEGTYSLTFTCDGYFSKTVTADVVNHQQTRLDVQMVPLNISVENRDVKHVSMAFPNPSDGNFRLVFPATSKGQSHVEIYNSTGAQVLNQSYPGNLSSVEMNLGNLSAGLYFIKVESPSGIFSDRIVIY